MAKRENPDKGYAGYLKRIYGITIKEYYKMLEDQGGGCAVCGKTPGENGRRLAVDHDHETGEVRGLLCSSCNTGLGNFKDDPQLLESAMYYLMADMHAMYYLMVNMLESGDYLGDFNER